MQDLNFTAIDFETANGSRASACAVGLARVVGGEVVSTASWLIRPPEQHADFASFNMRVHGISAEDVHAADGWADILPQVMAFSGGGVFVAHNAPFDASVFAATTTASGVDAPPAEFYCSLELSRRHLELPDNKLPTVAQALGVVLTRHHDAAADARACAEVVLALARRHHQPSIAALWTAGPSRGRAREGSGARPAAAASPSRRLSDLPQPNLAADPHTAMYGQVFVFTGEMNSLDRDEAMEAVARHGGSNGNNITKKTTILVAATTGTGKERRARDSMAAGQQLTILSEEDFVLLLASVEPRITPAVASVSVPRRSVPEALRPTGQAPAPVTVRPAARESAPSTRISWVSARLTRLRQGLTPARKN